jgi:ankyrin repeat protein
VHLSSNDPAAIALTAAIQQGNLDQLATFLELAGAAIVDEKGVHRTPLHIATDWPGHFPNVARSIRTLIEAGANPNTPCTGVSHHAETPLHWAASSNDIDAIDALLDGGADIEAPGAVFTGGTAMSDAVIFAQYDAARRLLARGAKTTFSQAAALGLLDRMLQEPLPARDDLTKALWHSCRAGQAETSHFLLSNGANPDWLGWDHITPRGNAKKSGNAELLRMLSDF